MSDQKLTQLHLGLGSFHRAHQAFYMQLLHDLGDERWQLAGGNIRPDGEDIITALRAQKGCYTLETVNTEGDRQYHRIDAIKRFIDWKPDLSGLVDLAVSPSTRIISFTVTEAGYYLDSNENLDQGYADLRSDLSGATNCTLYGALALLLDARRRSNAGPITLMNCDNLRSNGDRFKTGFEQFLTLRKEEELLAWVAENTSAPNAMVDRITPRPSSEVSERVRAVLGIDDRAALMSETFIQWVLEDDFINGRPEWEKVGVELVESVEPYEEAKIRILNATHSCIAWAGTLAGYNFIHEGTLDPSIRRLAFDYVTNDVIPVLTPSPLDLEAYRDTVLDRFSNPYVLDTNSRVAMDGFSKMPNFVLPTIKDCLSSHRSLESVAVLPALFLAVLLKEHQHANPFPYVDQLMDSSFTERLAGALDPVSLLCNERLLFNELAGNPLLVSAVRNAFDQITKLNFSERLAKDLAT